jgi:hypothetical protein
MSTNAFDQLLAQYDEHVTGLAAKLQQFVFKHLPDVKEDVDIPAKLLGYSYGPGYKHMVCTILFSKKGVKLGFYKGIELPDPQQLLTGTGRYIAMWRSIHRMILNHRP